MRLTARVPATAANLGPGFDSFGLALDLCNEVTVDTDAEPGVEWEGEGAEDLPTDGSDLVSASMRVAYERRAPQANVDAPRLPALRIRGTNRIPLASGLGSSAAATVAGVALAHALLGRFEPGAASTYVIAAGLEGHPDNAAPCVFGGLTIATEGAVHRVDPHPSLRPVLLVPEGLRVSTDAARRALPATVPFSDAVFNAAHAGLTLLALIDRPDALAEAMRDRLHQDVRLALAPTVRRTFDSLRGRGVPVCVSGSGPALLAFELGDLGVPDPGDGWRVLRVGVRTLGVEVVEG
jgi:homoserine kinase